MLELYRAALQLRRASPALATPGLAWLPSAPDVLCYQRGAGLTVVINLSARPVPVPGHAELLVTSGPLRDGLLPPDTAAWLRDPR